MGPDHGRLEWQVHDDPGDELREQTHKACRAFERILDLGFECCPYEDQVAFSGFLSATGTVLGSRLKDVVGLTDEQAHEALAEYGTFLTKFLRKWGDVAEKNR